MDNRWKKVEAVKCFKKLWQEQNTYDKDDRVAKCEAWNDWIDMLHRNGEITDWQVNNWSNPF